MQSSKPISLTALTLAAVIGAHSISANGAAQQVLHVRDRSTEGQNAANTALVPSADGSFFGTAYGGSNGIDTVYGDVVYKVTAQGAVSVVHQFTSAQQLTAGFNIYSNSDGVFVNGLMLAPDGNFYGTTASGGPAGAGVIFRQKPDGSFAVLHTFEASPCCSQPNNGGAYPTLGPLALASDGFMYGTTASGGANGAGTLFKLGTDGSFAVLFSFAAGNALSNNVVAGQDGNFYTVQSGSVVKITPAGAWSVLYTAPQPASVDPGSLTRGRDGNLYATTSSTLFKLSYAGTYSALHVFAPGPHQFVYVGYLYGWWEKTLMDINAEGIGAVSLVQTADGNLYGSNLGGYSDAGTIFRFSPDGVFTTLFTFDAGQQPVYPRQTPGILADDGSGNLIAATRDNESAGHDLIYKILPAAPLSVTASFTKPNVKLWQPTQLSWSSTNASACSVHGDFSALQGSLPTSGTRSVTLYRKQARTDPAAFFAVVECTGSDGNTATATATLTIQ